MMRLAALLFVFLFAIAVWAQRASPPRDASTATMETLGAIVETDGWCVTGPADQANLMASIPARLTAVEQARVRFIEVVFHAGATSTRGCHLLSTSSPVSTIPALACNALDGDAVGVLRDGSVARYAVGRNFSAGGLPSVTVGVNAGTDGSFCINVGF